MQQISAEALDELLELVDGLSPEDAVTELYNAVEEIRWGWTGATVTPRLILGNVVSGD